jgi:hypothetical protein
MNDARARRGLRIVRDIYATVMLGAAVYFGLTGADDILNTTTLGERSVGVTATLYGIAAAVALYAYWRRARWLLAVTLVWGVLITVTGTLATIVYEGGLVGAIVALLVSGLIAASVYYACRSRLRETPTD